MTPQKKLSRQRDEVTYLIPKFDGMHIPPEVSTELDEQYGERIRAAIDSDDPLAYGELIDKAWVLYCTLMRDNHYGIYDDVSQQMFKPTAKQSLPMMLYRHYFNRFPPTEFVPDIEQGITAYGLRAVSSAMKTWRDNLYNPSSIIAILNMASHLSDRREPIRQPVHDVFKETP